MISSVSDWSVIIKGAVSVVVALVGGTKAWLVYKESKAKREEKRQGEIIAKLKTEQAAQRVNNQRVLEQQQVNGLQAISYIYQIMDALTKAEKPIADRVIIFQGHNGGDSPAPGSAYYISAVHSSSSKHLRAEQRPENQYRRVSIDAHYLHLLLQTMADEDVLVATDKLPQGQLLDYFNLEGVHTALLFRMGYIGHTYVYGSIAMLGKDFTPSQLTIARRSVNNMRTSFQDSMAVSAEHQAAII